MGYSALNTCRSAVSSLVNKVENVRVGEHPVICALLKGFYHLHPPKPRYTHYWDVDVILNMFQSWGCNSMLSLKYLSFKVAVLLLLVTSSRGQTIVHLPVQTMEIGDNIVFNMIDLLKHNHPGDPLDTVILSPFPDDQDICVVLAIKEYLKRTENIRKNSNYLLLSFQKPHKPIGGETLSRWTKEVFKLAGIDVERFSRHSTRGATTSKAKSLGLSVKQIINHAKWKNVESFAKHYDKKVNVDPSLVATTLLKNAVRRKKKS